MPDLAGSLHDRYVAPRRVRILANLVAPLLPGNARVLDVGCGDGAVSRAIQRLRPDLHIEGVEVLLRHGSQIPVTAYDGKNIPFPDRSFDSVVMVDVLHHAVLHHENGPEQLLREAARIASQCVVVKDHLREGLFAAPTLRFMDWVGNARHGVALPYHYWRRAQWQHEFERVGLVPVRWNESLRLYPWPASLIFDRRLHFVCLLEKMADASHARQLEP